MEIGVKQTNWKKIKVKIPSYLSMNEEEKLTKPGHFVPNSNNNMVKTFKDSIHL